jgi:hypothetical protein
MTLAKHSAIVTPLTAPLIPNFCRNPPFLRAAKTKYAALHADVRPAESVLKPWRLRYELKRKMGGKSIGSGWKGRRCWAAMRVAVRVGAMEFSIRHLLAIGDMWRLGKDGVPPHAVA